MTPEERARALDDYATSRKTPFTKAEAIRAIGITSHQFVAALRRIRRMYDDQPWTLICDPQNGREPHLYQWVKGYDGAKFWLQTRVKDGDTRLRTILAVSLSVKNAENPRSIEGRKAALRVKVISRLIEDLGDLDEAANGG